MISLNYRDSRPIYEQIKEGLKRLVITGALRDGDRLPSVRELAADLSINPNTIQRAYRELESDGYIYTIAGKGSFAAPQANVSSGLRAELYRRFDEAASELVFSGCSLSELHERIENLKQKGSEKIDRG